jgi:hypothetical protein
MSRRASKYQQQKRIKSQLLDRIHEHIKTKIRDTDLYSTEHAEAMQHAISVFRHELANSPLFDVTTFLTSILNDERLARETIHTFQRASPGFEWPVGFIEGEGAHILCVLRRGQTDLDLTPSFRASPDTWPGCIEYRSK